MDTNTPSEVTPNQEAPAVEPGRGHAPLVPRRTAPERAKPKAATATRVVQQERDLLLVEWHTGFRTRRAWVTPDMVEAKTDNAATVHEPGEGIPYGVDWSRLVELHTTPAAIEEELHARGIWTIADLRSKPVEVVAAIQAAYGFSRAHLLQAAERYEEKLKKES